MPNSQNSLDTSNTVTKLLEVDAELERQEVELSAQLKSIQEKRHSLRTVIDLFAPINTAIATPTVTQAQIPGAEAEAEIDVKQAKPTAQDVAASELDGLKTDTNTDAETLALPDKAKRQAKKNQSPASSKQSTKSLLKKKTNKELESWQQYVRDEFSNASLSEAVSEVMQQQSEQILEIATILDAIFIDEIPPEVRSKARERVSNVLSVGVKKEKWYRGEPGSYSMSKPAV